MRLVLRNLVILAVLYYVARFMLPMGGIAWADAFTGVPRSRGRRLARRAGHAGARTAHDVVDIDVTT
jgi:hypothetical protein